MRTSSLFLVLGLMLMATNRVQAERPLIGVYYYVWYNKENPWKNTFAKTARDHLVPKQHPTIQPYDSRDAGLIAEHLDQSQRAGIDFWALSWWGPNHHTDQTIREHVLAHPRADEMRYAIHYEAPGRLGTMAQPDLSNLLPDFSYLAEHFFGRDDYLKIDGKPVVIIYLTREFFKGVDAPDTVTELRRMVRENFGYDMFLIGDDYFTDPLDPQRAMLWDAVTAFDSYGMAFEQYGATQQGIDTLAAINDRIHAQAQGLNVGFVPTVSPGYNDTAMRDGHVPLPRYMVDEGEPRKYGSLFRRMLSDIALPHTDPAAENMLLVNSFNEWYEDTQIESVSSVEPTNRDDAEGRYTGGHFYEGYGDRYLNILREEVDAAATP